MRTFIPNMLTSMNLVFGMGSIMLTFQGSFYLAAIFIVLAMVADGLDGRVARFFKVSSEFGKELDSLCDLVSFGVAPAFLAYVFFLHEFSILGPVAAILFAVCGALRLARFNVNAGVVKGFFMGLPIPAGGCVLATFIMLDIKLASYLFPLMVVVVGYLMVSKVRYPDFKGKGEKIYFIPALLSIALGAAVLTVRMDAFLFVPFIVYAVFGILNTAFGLLSGRELKQEKSS